MLVIDDLQWADPASVALWGRLARSARQVPLLLVGMTRPVAAARGPAGAAPRGATTPPGVQLASLGRGRPWPNSSARLAGGRPDAGLLRLAAGAAGNPLYLTELLAALARGSSLAITEAGAAQLAGGSVPDSLPGGHRGPPRVRLRAGHARSLRAAALLGTGVRGHRPDHRARPERDRPGSRRSTRPAAAGVLTDSGQRPGVPAPADQGGAVRRACRRRYAPPGTATPGTPSRRPARRRTGSPGSCCGRPAADGGPEPLDEWMLELAGPAADSLVGQAPGVAAELLARAVASIPAGSATHGWLASRLADALYRTGDQAAAEQVAERALGHATDPDLLVDLHWTLTQCRIWPGSAAESFAALDRALASPGISARHRARLLVLAARTLPARWRRRHSRPQVADRALAAAPEADDNVGHGLGAPCARDRGRRAGASGRRAAAVRPGLAVTETDPALTDLGLLLQVNKAITLCNLDRYDEALATGRAGPAARRPGRHGDPAGSGARRPRPAALRDRAVGRRAGRDRDRAGGPEGTCGGLRRARHRRP